MTAAFDPVAETYDELWTNTTVGQLQRVAFWRVVGPLFTPGDTVLDLGCGTGEDAALLRERGISVIAIDNSPRMVARARGRGIDARVLGIEDIAQLEHKFDGAYSNFGALNCVARLSDHREPLARLIRPGGYLAICVIGRFCLWETLWYALHGQFRKAVRRWSGEASSSLGLTVYYPGVREIRDALSPEFEWIASAGIGVCIPPSYVRDLSARMLRIFERIDIRIAAWRGIQSLADHRLLVFRRP